MTDLETPSKAAWSERSAGPRLHVLVEIRRIVPASLEFLENIAIEFRAALTAWCCEPDAFAAELLFREALTNSVVHGCGLNPTLRVSIGIRVREDSVVIAVEDEGSGFNWRCGLDREAAHDATCGRGMEIYRAYADRIRFNRSGNRLVLVRRFRAVRK